MATMEVAPYDAVLPDHARSSNSGDDKEFLGGEKNR